MLTLTCWCEVVEGALWLLQPELNTGNHASAVTDRVDSATSSQAEWLSVDTEEAQILF